MTTKIKEKFKTVYLSLNDPETPERVKDLKFFMDKGPHGDYPGLPCMTVQENIIFVGGKNPHLKNYDQSVYRPVKFPYKVNKKRMKKWLKRKNFQFEKLKFGEFKRFCTSDCWCENCVPCCHDSNYHYCMN